MTVTPTTQSTMPTTSNTAPAFTIRVMGSSPDEYPGTRASRPRGQAACARAMATEASTHASRQP